MIGLIEAGFEGQVTHNRWPFNIDSSFFSSTSHAANMGRASSSLISYIQSVISHLHEPSGASLAATVPMSRPFRNQPTNTHLFLCMLTSFVIPTVAFLFNIRHIARQNTGHRSDLQARVSRSARDKNIDTHTSQG
jgi:hypothetical protein